MGKIYLIRLTLFIEQLGSNLTRYFLEPTRSEKRLSCFKGQLHLAMISDKQKDEGTF